MFKVGDKIVYPMHGAGVIESIEFKEVLGNNKEYYILKLAAKNMVVMLPVDNSEKLGIRAVVAVGVIDEVVEVLKKGRTQMPANWNKRNRANMERVKTGDIMEITEVVRNLELLDREKGLSTGEKKMLSNTKQMLISELVLSNDLEAQEVEDLINTNIGNN